MRLEVVGYPVPSGAWVKGALYTYDGDPDPNPNRTRTITEPQSRAVGAEQAVELEETDFLVFRDS